MHLGYLVEKIMKLNIRQKTIIPNYCACESPHQIPNQICNVQMWCIQFDMYCTCLLMVNYTRQNSRFLWVTQTQISEVMKLYIIVNYPKKYVLSQFIQRCKNMITPMLPTMSESSLKSFVLTDLLHRISSPNFTLFYFEFLIQTVNRMTIWKMTPI
jgi:hypothetical protein